MRHPEEHRDMPVPDSTSTHGGARAWGVDVRGDARDHAGTILPPEAHRDLLQALASKVEAGEASVTERRCLYALQGGGGS